MHQGSALSPLLFVIVMEALYREIRVVLPWQLYAHDLVVIAETEDLIKTLNEWKDNVEHRGMRVIMNKTTVMISGEWQKVMQKAVKWPCGVCGRRTTQVNQYQKDKTNSGLLVQEIMSGSGISWAMQICTLPQSDNHASTRSLSSLQGRCPSCHSTISIKASKA